MYLGLKRRRKKRKNTGLERAVSTKSENNVGYTVVYLKYNSKESSI